MQTEATDVHAAVIRHSASAATMKLVMNAGGKTTGRDDHDSGVVCGPPMGC